MSDSEKRFPLRLGTDLYAKLEMWADEEFRSVNQQIIKILHEAVARRSNEREAEGEGNKNARRSDLR